MILENSIFFSGKSLYRVSTTMHTVQAKAQSTLMKFHMLVESWIPSPTRQSTVVLKSELFSYGDTPVRINGHWPCSQYVGRSIHENVPELRTPNEKISQPDPDDPIPDFAIYMFIYVSDRSHSTRLETRRLQDNSYTRRIIIHALRTKGNGSVGKIGRVLNFPRKRAIALRIAEN